jgi:hypothetical protein
MIAGLVGDLAAYTIAGLLVGFVLANVYYRLRHGEWP